jgi:hypothetical protein
VSGWARVAALLIAAHILGPVLPVCIAAAVTAFVLTLAVLAWLLVTGRGTLAPVWRARPAGIGGT